MGKTASLFIATRTVTSKRSLLLALPQQDRIQAQLVIFSQQQSTIMLTLQHQSLFRQLNLLKNNVNGTTCNSHQDKLSELSIQTELVSWFIVMKTVKLLTKQLNALLQLLLRLLQKKSLQQLQEKL